MWCQVYCAYLCWSCGEDFNNWFNRNSLGVSRLSYLTRVIMFNQANEQNTAKSNKYSLPSMTAGSQMFTLKAMYLLTTCKIPAAGLIAGNVIHLHSEWKLLKSCQTLLPDAPQSDLTERLIYCFWPSSNDLVKMMKVQALRSKKKIK